jgi:hypothetical protein
LRAGRWVLSFENEIPILIANLSVILVVRQEKCGSDEDVFER